MIRARFLWIPSTKDITRFYENHSGNNTDYAWQVLSYSIFEYNIQHPKTKMRQLFRVKSQASFSSYTQYSARYLEHSWQTISI